MTDKRLSERVLSDDFIDEAQVRFARGITKELAADVLRRARERVATLEAERDEWKRIAAQRYNDFSTMSDVARHAESRIATARVEGAREALTRFCWSDGGMSHRIVNGGECEHHAVGNCRVLRFRDREYPAPSPQEGEATRDVSGSIGFKVTDSSPVREAVRVQGNVVTIDCDAVREMAERADRNVAITGAASLRVGGSCADCQALNPDASVTWKTCPKHTLNLRASESGDTAQGSRVDFRTLDNRGVKEVLSDPAPTPEPEKNVYLPVGILSHRGAFVPSASMVRVTPEDCRRIVALGSRPTQTAEG